MEGRNVINGTFGKVWLDGSLVAECTGLKAVMKMKKEAVVIPGQLEEDTKVTGIQCTGNLKMLKVNSRMAQLIANRLSEGEDVRFKIVSSLTDPCAKNKGFEKVELQNVSFDDLTIMDWEGAKYGTIDAPFTFTKHIYYDKIGV